MIFYIPFLHSGPSGKKSTLTFNPDVTFVGALNVDLICSNDTNSYNELFYTTFYRDHSYTPVASYTNSTNYSLSSLKYGDKRTYTCQFEWINNRRVKLISAMSDPVVLHVRDIGKISFSNILYKNLLS